MISAISILNTSRSGPGQLLTLVGYSSGLPGIAEAIQFKSDSLSPSQQSSDPFNDTPVGTNEVVLTNDSIMVMNKKVLKEELNKRRLRISGNKRALQERFVAAVEGGEPIGVPIILPPVRKFNKEAED